MQEEQIHYLSRADFNKTFPKANVPVRRLSHKGAALNLYTKELADTWHSDETWTAFQMKRYGTKSL